MTKKQTGKNWILFLLAFIVSCMLWYMVIANSDARINLNLGDVDVTFVGEEDLHESGYAVFAEDSTKIGVSVTVAQEKGWLVSSSNIRLKADLGEITSYQDENVLYLRTEILANASVIGSNYKLEKNYITVRCEKLVDEDIPVSVETSGTPANGYRDAEGTAAADTVHAKVPESIAGTGIYAVATADIDGAEEDYSGPAKLQFFHADGTLIDTEESQIIPDQNTMQVLVPIGKLQEIGLELPEPSDVTIDGRKCIAVTSEQSDFAMIRSADAVGDEIQSISIPASVIVHGLTASDLDEDSSIVTVKLSDYLPEGYSIYRKIDDNVGVEVVTRALKQTTLQADTSSVVFENLGSGLECTVTGDSCTVAVEAVQEYLDLLKAEDIVLTVDLTGYGEGSYFIEPQVSISSDNPDDPEYTILSVGRISLALKGKL